MPSISHGKMCHELHLYIADPSIYSRTVVVIKGGGGGVTPMTTILRTAISVTILHMVDVGVAWVWLYSSHSQGGFLPRSQGHRQFSSVVTQS